MDTFEELNINQEIVSNSLRKLPKWFDDFYYKLKNQTSYDVGFDNIKDVIRIATPMSASQLQSSDVFGFKWEKQDTFNSENSLKRMREWLIERYGDPIEILKRYSDKPIVLDAGCGAGMSAIEYWSNYFDQINYLAVDVSSAVDVCKQRCLEKCINDAVFMQADISNLPLPKESIDIIFSEGVMHHTDSTLNTFNSLTSLLKKGGIFMFYIYKKKAPIREFSDDYIREKCQKMTPSVAWASMESLTKLGKALGELDTVIDIPENVDLLDIPAGKIDIQRLFYWHIFKAFYHKDLSLEEMNHINYDWYAPKNAHRHTIEEVRTWCVETDLKIEREVVEPAGITIIAQKRRM